MIDVIKSDILFKESAPPGPGCLCSRCLQPILQTPLRHTVGNNGEYRFHFACQGHNRFYDLPPLNKSTHGKLAKEGERAH